MGMHKVVDVHAHILLPGVMGSCGAAGPEMGFRENGTEYFRAGDYVLENVRFNNSPFSVPAQRIEKMAAMGIDLQLVSPNPLTYFYHQSKQSAIEFNKKQNDEIAAVCSTRSQLVGAASLPLQDPQASCKELNRAVGTLGLVCSYIGTDVNGLALSDPQFEELWSEHERLGVPVVIHPGPRGSYQKPDTFFDKWELDVIYGFGKLKSGKKVVVSGSMDTSIGLYETLLAQSLLGESSQLVAGAGTGSILSTDVVTQTLRAHNGFIEIKRLEVDESKVTESPNQEELIQRLNLSFDFFSKIIKINNN